MDIVRLLELTSAITGIISFILYFLDKKERSSSTERRKHRYASSDWRIWLVITGSILMLVIAFKIPMNSAGNNGIVGDDNNNNTIIIAPHEN